MLINKIKLLSKNHMPALYTHNSSTNTFTLWGVVDDDSESETENENEFLEPEIKSDDFEKFENEFVDFGELDKKLNWTVTKSKTKKRKQVKPQILVDGDLIKNRHHPATKANCVKARNEMRLFKAG
jgi:hypothetical protein